MAGDLTPRDRASRIAQDVRMLIHETQTIDLDLVAPDVLEQMVRELHLALSRAPKLFRNLANHANYVGTRPGLYDTRNVDPRHTATDVYDLLVDAGSQLAAATDLLHSAAEHLSCLGVRDG